LLSVLSNMNRYNIFSGGGSRTCLVKIGVGWDSVVEAGWGFPHLRQAFFLSLPLFSAGPEAQHERAHTERPPHTRLMSNFARPFVYFFYPGPGPTHDRFWCWKREAVFSDGDPVMPCLYPAKVRPGMSRVGVTGRKSGDGGVQSDCGCRTYRNADQTAPRANTIPALKREKESKQTAQSRFLI